MIEEYDSFVRERAQQLISDVDYWLAAAERRTITDPAARTKLGVSVYQYVAPQEEKIQLEAHVITGQ